MWLTLKHFASVYIAETFQKHTVYLILRFTHNWKLNREIV